MTSRKFLAALGLVWGVGGLVEPHLPDAGEALNAVGIIQGIVTSVVLFAWCKAHARVHAVRPGAGAALLVGLIAPVGVPYYAFSGFGFRGGVRLIGSSVVASIGVLAIYVVCYELSVFVRFGQFARIF